jgi:hypothetical protein
MVVNDVVINDKGDTIPVSVNEENGTHVIKIDGVEWVRTDNYMHATVLLNMISEHITEYVHYKKNS